jgi:beta-glucanase (GH16 family)
MLRHRPLATRFDFYQIALKERTPMSNASISLRTLTCASLATLMFAACGGGGGGSNPTTETASIGSASPSAGSDSTPDTASTGSGSPSAGSTGSAKPSTPTSSNGPFGQDASKYELAFSDEFENGFDTSKWNDYIWYSSSQGPKNYTVEDGKLKMWPQADSSGRFHNRTIDTDGKYYQTYGYFEIEAKLPVGKGTWPAFWLLNHDGAGNLRPEIDILEAYAGGGPNSGWSDSKLHPTAFAATSWPRGIENGLAGTKTHQPGVDLSAGFHKYAVKWEPGKQTYYFDGKEFLTVNSSMSSRMYILLDLWYGSASGNPDGSTPQGKSNSYEVNYVRAWKLK